MKNNNIKRQLTYLMACLALIVAGLVLLVYIDNREKDSASPEDEAMVYFDGAWYRQRDDLETVLVLGLDEMEHPNSDEGYRNSMQSDFILLLVIDNEKKACRIMQLNRDAMTEIPILGVSGDEAGSFTGQLALAHTYGSGKVDSGFNVTNAVSNLLFGVPVEHFISVTMDGVAKMNDLVGGVSVKIEDDFSKVDASLVKGQTITLKGSQALSYVRARGGMQDSSNLKRMKRQRTYMTALYQKVAECMEENDDFIKKAVTELTESVVSDYTQKQLSKLGEILETYDIGEITELKGEAKKGEEFMEFYVDEEALRKTVIEVFYEKTEEKEQ